MKYIFVTGGVVSSLGKGLAAASLGTLLEQRGLKIVGWLGRLRQRDLSGWLKRNRDRQRFLRGRSQRELSGLQQVERAVDDAGLLGKSLPILLARRQGAERRAMPQIDAQEFEQQCGTFGGRIGFPEFVEIRLPP